MHVHVPTHSTALVTLVVFPGVSKLKERMDAAGLTDRVARGDREHESDDDAHNRYVLTCTSGFIVSSSKL